MTEQKTISPFSLVCLFPSKTPLDGALKEQLVLLWEASVRASHHFLTEEDIKTIRVQVETAFDAMHALVLVRHNKQPVGFLGCQGNKIEMLFLHPQYFAKGLGRMLIHYAQQHFAVAFVDVNEDNPHALGFYQHLGFVVQTRDALDSLGRPFPILHLAFAKEKDTKEQVTTSACEEL